MKIKSILIAFALVAATFALAQKKTISTSESMINWKGEKLTGSHFGTLNFSEGFLNFESGVLIGGELTVDMTSLKVTDLKPGKGKEKLERHLGSGDFFDVKNYKTAKLVISKATKSEDGYKVTGDLTIKGKTNPVSFDLAFDGDSAKAKLVVDRTKYGVTYKSKSFFDNLKNKVIYDDFELEVNLKM